MALNSEESRRLSFLKFALDSLLYKEEIYWRQRASTKWLKAGDRNTKFFHKHASFRKKVNTIKFLKTEDGSVVNTQEGIVNLITDYFQNLFSTQGSDVHAASAIFSYLNFGLEDSDVSFLHQDFTPEEVRRAVFQISGDKAVGLDGFNAHFYEKNWSVLGSDLTKAILDCLNHAADFSSINSSLIVLIPKKQRAHSLKDFRPISLCTTFYKIISKTLANRLKVVLDKIISPNQSAFISGRIIFDNILLANEVVHTINNRKNGKVGWAALKLDMSKAFDRVEWDFLQSLMYHFNFPVKFVSNIMKCLTTATISFSVNGEVCGKVFPTRGLRQGDPLSPYLFILCSEGLFALLHHSQCQGVLKGVAISRTAPSLTHLLFADDSLLFCTATPSSCEALNLALHTYSQASGQLINFDKSSILFSPNTQANVRDMFMHTLRMVDKPFISKYLGLPQCFSRAKYQSFAFLKDKAVLEAIPSYAMACFRIPTKICKELESMVSKFWWGSSPNRPSIHWKKWSMICQSKFVGGMGFRSLVHFNQAMLAKQAWRIFQNPNSLLSLTLQAMYFPHTSFLDAVPGHNPSFSWRSIIWGRDLLKRGLLWKVGNGQTINTINDRWLPNFALKDSDLIAALPSPSLSYFISPSGAWDLNKLRCHFPVFIIDHILDIPIAGHMCSDVLIWGKDNSGIFNVKSTYHLAISHRDIPSSSSPLGNKRFWSKLWFSSIPAKVKHCVWRILLNSIPVASNLYHRHIIPAPLCPLCHVVPETVTHAFLECSRVKTAWKNSSFYIFYAEHKSLNIYAYISKAVETFDKRMLCIFFCFLWMVWSQRNNYLHHHRCLSPMFIFDHAVAYLQDFESANLKAEGICNVQRSSISHTSLVAPSRYRINTDAAIDLNLKKHSLGVVVRDAQDQVVAGVIAPVIGHVPPDIAEAKALLLALEWAQNVNLPVDVVESDCKSLVDKVNGSFSNYSVMSDFVVRIRHLLSFSPTCILSFVPRELNKLAHNCARAGLGLDGEYSWNGCLPSLLS
uniref:Reverse transcriptase domain-containing protein n=1 Tax=Cannabis sativa TaxID=3483 RepID=A0A803PYN6_CANSA